MTNDTKLTKREKWEVTIKTAVQAIPYVGGPLSTAIFDVQNERKIKKLKNYLDSLRTEFEDYKEGHFIPKDEEEFAALVEKILDQAQIEYKEKKIGYLRNFFKSAVECDSQGLYDRQQFFLKALSEMDIVQCQILQIMYENENRKVLQGIFGVVAPETQFDEYELLGAVNRLADYGFLMTYYNNVDFTNEELELSLNKTVQISDFGKQFTEFCLKDK